MVPENDDPTLEPRFPTLKDLLFLCQRLNQEGAKYIVIGGMAVIEYGFGRATEDIDLLVEGSPQNQEKIRAAMLSLPDGAIREVEPGDLEKFVVIRVADEFVVDLMLKACGVGYNEGASEIEARTIEGIAIPFASPKLLLRLKQTYREKDAIDRAFLNELIQSRKDKRP